MANRTAIDYRAKFDRCSKDTCFPRLAEEEQLFIRGMAEAHRFTFQELRQVSEAALDLRMWKEASLGIWWERQESDVEARGRTKERFFQRLDDRMAALRVSAKSYPEEGMRRPETASLKPVTMSSERDILGMCPVASEETVCCNLRTIDAVQNCGMGCSYCTIQTFYGDRVTFDADLPAKLAAMELEPDRFYHIGTGQSSDSLMWGNQHGLLDSLCDFARAHPNILLEFKTKSANVAYFLRGSPPANIVLSWSLNPPAIIRNEEHFTADLPRRLEAARRVADRGIGVAFHFHPMVYYDSWREDYGSLATAVTEGFLPKEVLFLSMGSVTFIKPVMKAIRGRGRNTKMLQMELVRGPKGKLSYPADLKREMFGHMYRAFEPWHGRVFMYLCMEEAAFWHSTFGCCYDSNEEFEAAFGDSVREKLEGLRAVRAVAAV